MFTAFTLIALALAEPLTDLLLGEDIDASVVRISLGATWCYGVGYMLIDLLRWRMRPRQFAFVSVAMTAVVTASSAIYVLALDLGVEGAVLGQLTGFAVGLLCAAYLHRDLLGLHFDTEPPAHDAHLLAAARARLDRRLPQRLRRPRRDPVAP